VNDLLPFIIIGLTAGGVYGLSGIGIVLTYKTTGILNFAQGSISALSAFVFYFLYQQHHMPWPLALALCVLVLAPALGLGLELFARPLGTASPTIKLLATIGLVVTVLSLGSLWYPGNPRLVANFLPTGTFSIAGTYVGWDQLIIICFSLAVTGVLYWFLRFTRIGIAMRAVVDDPDLLSRTGENPIRVRRWAWILGTCLAAISGILLAPSLNLDATVLTILALQAFGAAAIGAFRNLPLAYVGGLIIGVAEAVSTNYTSTNQFWSAILGGIQSSLPFIVLFCLLIAIPRARLAERAYKPVVEVHRSWYAPNRVRVLAACAAFAFLAVVPTFAGVRLIAYSSVLVTAMLLASLGLLVKSSGQVSLCQLGFAAIGAAAMAHFTTTYGLPWPVGVLLGALLAVPVGAFIAIPAIRLSPVFLPLATFGFGVLLAQMFYFTPMMFGGTSSGIAAPRPSGSIWFWHFGSDKGYYFVLLVFMTLTLLALLSLQRGRLGRLLLGIADSALGLQSRGTTVNVTKVLVFCISAFVAGLAGALTASLYHFAVSDQYADFSSLTLFAVVAIVVIGDPWFALIGAASMQLIPSYIQGSETSTYLQLVFGVSATLYVFVAKRPATVPQRLRAVLETLGRVLKSRDVVRSSESEPAANEADRSLRSVSSYMRLPLTIRQVKVHFGGVVAVDNVSLVAEPGHVTGLVGPNGAGKTTVFNVCSGLIRPSNGAVVLGDHEITRLAPHKRARLGLGRTFQRSELFDSLTVEENVRLGREASLAGANPWAHLYAGGHERKEIADAASESMDLVGIGLLRQTQVGLLSTGQRRLVELATILAGRYGVLLLDEPSAGLDEAETRHFAQILRVVVQNRGVGIFLVEHDMELVRQLCDEVYVLDYGLQIFSGTPEEMESSEAVRAAYIGSEYHPGEAGTARPANPNAVLADEHGDTKRPEPDHALMHRPKATDRTSETSLTSGSTTALDGGRIHGL
jgi:ABC-type branched-subunit amino acid transport system ATPase component/branched-subunit amino acid ABC-type transport system permease component